jgi:hypothetical protein
VQTRGTEILEEALKPIHKARRETVRREPIEHGAEYVAQELAQEEDLTPGERASPERDVKRALEDDITGTESERDVEALVDDVLDDMVGGTENDGKAMTSLRTMTRSTGGG